MFNIAYLLILRTGGMKKSCEQWEDMQAGLKTWQDFKEYFEKAYRRYQIRKNATSAAHGYGESENHTQETEAQVNTVDALQALACTSMKDKEVMANLTRINLILSQSLTQSQETILCFPSNCRQYNSRQKQRHQPQREPH